jgi:hypothetical protein
MLLNTIIFNDKNLNICTSYTSEAALIKLNHKIINRDNIFYGDKIVTIETIFEDLEAKYKKSGEPFIISDFIKNNFQNNLSLDIFEHKLADFVSTISVYVKSDIGMLNTNLDELNKFNKINKINTIKITKITKITNKIIKILEKLKIKSDQLL